MQDVLALLLSTLWVGVLIGVSFIATPVKFRSAGLKRPVALDVGRVTFQLLSRIEWMFAVLLVALCVGTDRVNWRLSLAVATTGAVALQSLWLLPALNRRVRVVVSGGVLLPSPIHRIYAVAESAKLLMLLTLIAASLAALR